MLVPAPYQAPEKKAKKKAKGTRGGLRHMVTSDVTSEDAETHSPPATDDEEEEEEEESNSPLRGEGRKGRPPRVWRPKRPRGGEPPLWTTPHRIPAAARSGTPGISPRPNRKYSKALAHLYVRLLYLVILMR